MRNASVGSVNKILLMLAQSLFECSTLTSTDDFLVTIESYYYRHSQLQNHICMYVRHSITHVDYLGM